MQTQLAKFNNSFQTFWNGWKHCAIFQNGLKDCKILANKYLHKTAIIGSHRLYYPMGIRTGVSALVGYPEAPRPHGTSLIPQNVSGLYISTVLLYYMRIQFCMCSLFFWENAWKGLQVFSSKNLDIKCLKRFASVWKNSAWKPFIRLYKKKFDIKCLKRLLSALKPFIRLYNWKII